MTWKDGLAAFFSERADQVGSTPSVADLCYVSGRDPRLWAQHELYDDLVGSIVAALAAPGGDVLEVGCASGFVARGVAPAVGKYTGVDLSSAALAVARRLRLPNATFRVADGGRLPFAAAQFDAAFCYDVFTNFPDFETGAPIIAEMLRVVKPGSRVLIGSIPDAATKAAYEARTVEVGAELEARFGRVVPPAPRPPTLGKRLRDLLRTPAEPVIVCYYFQRADFEALARSLGCAVTITDIHPKNPYFGYRFNAIYTKPA